MDFSFADTPGVWDAFIRTITSGGAAEVFAFLVAILISFILSFFISKMKRADPLWKIFLFSTSILFFVFILTSALAMSPDTRSGIALSDSKPAFVSAAQSTYGIDISDETYDLIVSNASPKSITSGSVYDSPEFTLPNDDEHTYKVRFTSGHATFFERSIDDAGEGFTEVSPK